MAFMRPALSNRNRRMSTGSGTQDRVVRRPITRVKPDTKKGLNSDQVQERVWAGWTNVSVDPPSKTVRDIIRENLFTYYNLVFLVLTILLCLVGSFRNLTFLPVIIANILIGIIQQIRAKRTLDKLTMLNAPHATVLRNGKISKVDAQSLVIDDIVQFKSGNQICADAVVTEGSVQVNESLLTGESDEIMKNPGDRLMSGSFVVSGECFARLDAVGADSYISKLTLEAKAMPEVEQSEMIRDLNMLMKFVGIVLIPIGIALFVQGFFFNHETITSSVVSMVAAVIGMIPEGLYLLTSVALAVSSMRLAGQQVLLHDMRSIETLARVNVLCVDKTGTITENSMTVRKVVPTRHYKKDKMPDLEQLIGDFVNSMGDENDTMTALQDYFVAGTGRVPTKIVSFSSSYKYSGVAFRDHSYVLGAPEFILRDSYGAYKRDIEKYTAKGYRVLVYAIYDGELTGKALTQKVLPLAYILLSNPIRPNAKKTFSYFAEQGVDVKVISGDNPMTVSEVARQAGIPHADKYVDAATLHTDEEIYDAVAENTVFGRVTPEQKRIFIQALKAQGKTVAMTGDGVNDVLALKDADCSVAMASGSDAAVQASQVVLLNNDFACMPSVVAEGRRVVNNIQLSATLFLVKNIYSFLLAVFSMTLMITYPLEPSQVSLITTFTIGTPAFFLALMPNKSKIEGRFMANVALKALPAGITDVLVVGAMILFGQVFGVDSVDISTAATMLLAIVGFMILFQVCKPFNVIRGLVWCGCVLGLLACSIFLPDLFAITGMSSRCIMLFVVFAIVTEPMLRYLTAFSERVHQRYLRRLRERGDGKSRRSARKRARQRQLPR